jgi:hypothetical protein
MNNDDYIAKCPNCGKDYCIMNTTFKFEENTYCMACIRNVLETTNKPYFIMHIPDFVDGATARCFTFDTVEELIEKINMDNSTGENICTYDGNSLMIQSIKKDFCWVKGNVKNFDLSLCGIPQSNYDIYDNGQPISEKITKWLDGKKIIYY